MAFLKKIVIAVILIVSPGLANAEKIKDLADVAGMQSNPILGYGIVVGLNGTGDTSNSSPFTISSIVSMLNNFSIDVKNQVKNVKPKNVAAVIVTAELPAFSRPGRKLDIHVSSLGDAKSLQGGTLLMTPLLAGKEMYAIAQGAISLGGFSASSGGASKSNSHPTSGLIPNGAKVVKLAPSFIDSSQPFIEFAIRNPDFTTAVRMERVINAFSGEKIATAVDPATVRVKNLHGSAVGLVASLEGLSVTSDNKAVVVVDEKTGTIVMGGDVSIDSVAVSHGGINVKITPNTEILQPNAFSEGQTASVSNPDVKIEQKEAKLVMLPKQVSLNSLVEALNAVGATPSDLIAVLRAIKASGALHAELRVR